MTHTTRIWRYYAHGCSVSIRKKLFLAACFHIVFLFFFQHSFAQDKHRVYLDYPAISNTTHILAPPNDDCGSAQSVTPDGTCYSGTNLGANDSWVSTVGCQSGNNHPDVWYTFVATGSTLTVNITAGTMSGNIEFTLVSSTSTCTGLATVGSLCGPSPLTGTINGLQAGTRYYYTISSTNSGSGTFTTCVTNSSSGSTAGQDCGTALILCNANSFSQSTSNSGYGTQEVTTNSSCWASGGERQSKWFKFTASNSGILEFNIKPNTLSDDYDWAIWDITTLGCPSLANVTQKSIACNWSGCTGSTGLSSCPANEPGVVACGGPGDACTATCGNYRAWGNWSAPYGTCLGCGGLTLIAGHSYALLVDNYTTSNDGFTLTFGGACNTGTAILGPKANFTYTSPSCGVYDFSATYGTSTSTYQWQFGDGNTSTLQNPSHTYATFGSYLVKLTITDALGCSVADSQTINVSAAPPTITTQPNNVTACVNGSATFTVVAGGSGNSYQWRKGGVAIPGATSSSYTINPVTLASAGNYDVVVSNGCGSVTSVTVTLTVNPSPTATISGTATVCQNAPSPVITFTGANATAPYTFTYKINGGPNQTISTTSGNSVTVSVPTATAGTFVYTLVSVSSANGCSQSQAGSATITVSPKPGPLIITHN